MALDLHAFVHPSAFGNSFSDPRGVTSRDIRLSRGYYFLYEEVFSKWMEKEDLPQRYAEESIRTEFCRGW